MTGTRITPKPMRLRTVLRSTVVVACAVPVAIGVSATAPAPAVPSINPAQFDQIFAPRTQIDVRVGHSDKAGRIEIYGQAGSRASVRKQGNQVLVRIRGNQLPDIGDLRVNPPPGVSTVDVRRDGNAVELVLTLAEGAESRFGRADGGVFVQVAAEPQATLQAFKADSKAREAVPVVPVTVETTANTARLQFDWPGQVPAAVFRRGEAVWIVFDADGDFRLPAGISGQGPIKAFNSAKKDGFTVIRLKAPQIADIRAENLGGRWVVHLGGKAPEVAENDPDKRASAITIGRDDSDGATALTANIAGASRVAWIVDPEVGDRFAVVTARGPVKNVAFQRASVEASLDATAHGLMVAAVADDITVSTDGDMVRVGRPRGLTLSAPSSWKAKAQELMGLPKPMIMPALVNHEDWAKTGEDGFLTRYAYLQELAAAEAGEKEKGFSARMALARFLVGSELAYEAQGLLDLLAKQTPQVMSDPEFRGLRAAAKVMARRYKSADADLGASILSADPSAALWRGYVQAKDGNWEEARRAFQQGASALSLFPPKWQVKFGIANAKAAYELKDYKAAKASIDYAVAQKVPPLDQLEARLMQAKIFEATGDKPRALRMFEAIARASKGSIATPAALRVTMLKMQDGQIKPAEAVQSLDAMRFWWRGDGTELEVVRALGNIYISQGRYREALEVLRGAGTRVSNDPASLALQNDLNGTFRYLFLEGGADGLQPIQALALFYDFRELTPVGADGDDMVRRLSRRLIDVDLLEQAAELLSYQVDNRLDGVAKAAVATDLAAIYLMNRTPEKALQTLWTSRTSLLPRVMNDERKVLEARALTELGRLDHALEVLGGDNSVPAVAARAEIAWKAKDWAGAAALLERSLGDRWKNTLPLSGEDETKVIRAGVAFSLANDDPGLKRLSSRYSPYIETAQAPEAMRIALSDLDEKALSPQDFAQAAAQADTFAGWISSYKQRLRERLKAAPQTAETKPAAAPAKKA